MPILAAKRQLKSHSLKIRLLKNVKANEICRNRFFKVIIPNLRGKTHQNESSFTVDVTITY